MVVFPNAKINLGLKVLHKRTDGYHELETIFYPIRHYDALEVLKSNNNVNHIDVTGVQIPGKKNLCIQAYELLQQKFHDLPHVRIHLHKNIPIGAGLGGGSSDGAFTLMLLNDIFNLALSGDQLTELALQLGSDCPFFIINKPCVGRGRGEKLHQVDVNLDKYKLIIVHPGIFVSTRDVFSDFITVDPKVRSLEHIISQPVTTWKHELVNDLESVVFKKYPDIEKIKMQLYESGALYASMSGSGSAVYGIFEGELPDLAIFQAHKVVVA